MITSNYDVLNSKQHHGQVLVMIYSAEDDLT